MLFESIIFALNIVGDYFVVFLEIISSAAGATKLFNYGQ